MVVFVSFSFFSNSLISAASNCVDDIVVLFNSSCNSFSCTNYQQKKIQSDVAELRGTALEGTGVPLAGAQWWLDLFFFGGGDIIAGF